MRASVIMAPVALPRCNIIAFSTPALDSEAPILFELTEKAQAAIVGEEPPPAA